MSNMRILPATASRIEGLYNEYLDQLLVFSGDPNKINEAVEHRRPIIPWPDVKRVNDGNLLGDKNGILNQFDASGNRKTGEGAAPFEYHEKQRFCLFDLQN
jgi:hypothetical protein